MDLETFLDSPEWIMDEYNCLVLYDPRFPKKMLAWISKRPHYCDRGHYQMNAEIPGLDWADSFPRYYMDLECAKQETVAFLKWRLLKERASK